MADNKHRNVVPFPGVSKDSPASGLPTEPSMTALNRAQLALRSSKMQLHLVTENVPAMIVYFDRNFICGFSNSQYAQFFGFSKAGILGKHMAEVIGQDSFDGILPHLQRVLAGHAVSYEAERKSYQGVKRQLQVSFAPDIDASGCVKGSYALVIDITASKIAENVIRTQALQQEAIAVYGQFALESRDIDSLVSNAAAMVTSGLDIDHSGVFRFLHGHQDLKLIAGVGWSDGVVGSATITASTGTSIRAALSSGNPIVGPDVRASGHPMFRSSVHPDCPVSSLEVAVPTSDGPFGILGAYRRDTRGFNKDDSNFLKAIATALGTAIGRQRVEERLSHVAQFDAITGLPNRTLFHDRLVQAMARARRRKSTLALIFLDLDGFKEINDTLGHKAGDRLLRSVGARLKHSLREGDTVARLGGDEFTVILEDLHDRDEATSVAHKVLGALARPLMLEKQEFAVTASAGLTVYPEDTRNIETLLKNADTAMYYAKDKGKNNLQSYTPQMTTLKRERVTLENQLRRAIEGNELFLQYQPQIDLQRGGIVGVEALARWQHPELGVVPPGRFIPLAEKTGLIVPIGRWALATACAQGVAWQERAPPLRIGVNVSARQFRGDLFQTVSAALGSSGLEPQWLELELTESLLMEDPETARATLLKLKGLGVNIAIDDFGSGYSSLSYLRHFPIDRLKIDQTFIRDLTTSPDDAAIARAIIALGHNMNIRVVAEGVETVEQLAFLRDNGCDVMQGYFFSEPVSADDCLEIMMRHSPQR
ncbi:MAG: EAL domain-containing protein [Pseudomonadota bacterium]|nr:EAL domain-containing protein [Pseudomonadota bacterium]